MLAYRYNDQKIYDGEINCQLDPLETKKQGKDVYLLPANSTFQVPPPEKDGFWIVFNGTDWEYIEINPDDDDEETGDEE